MYTTNTDSILFHQLQNTNIQIAYRDVGQGKNCLLFIHGLGNSLIGWEKNLNGLSSKYRCISIDLPGNGFSSKDKYPYSIEFFARSVAAFITELGIEKVVLVGHSMGGQIALWMTHFFPELVEKIILIAPAGLEKFTALEKTMMSTGMSFIDWSMSDKSKLKKALLASFYHLDTDSKTMIEQMVQSVELHTGIHYSKMIDLCIQSMLEDMPHHFLKDIQQQVLIIFGEMDAMIPNKFIHPYSTATLAQQAVQYFKAAELAMLPLAGHFVHWEKSKEVNKLIDEFLSQ